MMPKAPTAQCSSAPPVKRLYMPSTEAPVAACDSKNCARALPLRPGMRTTASSRQIASTTNVKRIRDLSSGILKQLLKVLAMAAIILSSVEGLYQALSRSADTAQIFGGASWHCHRSADWSRRVGMSRIGNPPTCRIPFGEIPMHRDQFALQASLDPYRWQCQDAPDFRPRPRNRNRGTRTVEYDCDCQDAAGRFWLRLCCAGT